MVFCAILKTALISVNNSRSPLHHVHSDNSSYQHVPALLEGDGLRQLPVFPGLELNLCLREHKVLLLVQHVPALAVDVPGQLPQTRVHRQTTLESYNTNCYF